jgi:O-antigen ligase
MTSSTLRAPNNDATITRLTRHSALDAAIFYGLLGSLLFGPLAFGAVEPWSIFILQSSAALLFILWIIRQAESEAMILVWNPLFFPMLFFAALVALQLAAGRTAYRYETISHALLYCAYGLLCFLAVQCLRRTSQLKTLTIVISTYGVGVAIFAIVQSMSSNGKLYWLRTPRSGGWIYGPYVNHNHYAGLMEMLAPIPLVVALTDGARGTHRIMAAIAAALMGGTIFLSGSRGGMLALALQLSLLAAVLINQRTGRRTAWVLGIVLIIALALLAWLGRGELSKRLASIHTEARTELSGGLRMTVNRDGLKMFSQKPWLGWGLGVFPDVYPQFRSFFTDFFVNEAHNDYLQLLVEMGVLGFASMLWFVIAMYRSAAPKLRNWTADINGAVALAAMLGATGILVHSFVDFNLQIPANAALFYVICVVAANHGIRTVAAKARPPAGRLSWRPFAIDQCSGSSGDDRLVMIVAIVITIPVAILMPTPFVPVPPSVVRVPAAFPLLVQLAASFVRLPATFAVSTDRLIQSGFRAFNLALAPRMVIIPIRSRNSNEHRGGRGCRHNRR